jgi:hypothetical protein
VVPPKFKKREYPLFLFILNAELRSGFPERFKVSTRRLPKAHTNRFLSEQHNKRSIPSSPTYIIPNYYEMSIFFLTFPLQQNLLRVYQGDSVPLNPAKGHICPL